MNRLRLTVIVLALIAVASIGSGLLAAKVSAQASNANAAQGIEISPALVELNAAPTKTYTVTLKITNVTGSDLSYTASVDDFGAAGESGSPRVIIDGTMPATASVKTWVETVPQFTLRSRESRVVTARIIIPANAEPGGHYGVLRFSGRAPDVKDTGVGLAASAGVLLLIRVDGAITEKANLASFFSEQRGDQSSFFEKGPLTFVTRIKNEGNIHVKPVGSIELRDMFGGLVTTLPVNADKSNVLPDSIRRFESSFDKSWMAGRYTANLTLGYGTTGQAITNTISFWVIPYKIILAVIFGLVTIIYIFSRMIKVYNKRIIAKSKHENTTKNKKSTGKKS